MTVRTTMPHHTSAPLLQLPIPAHVRTLMAGAIGLKAFTMGDCHILVAREPAGRHGGLRWHLSIACQDRYPTWDEVGDARARLLPDDVEFAMILPRRDEYVNVHDFCFHLHEQDVAS